jgi:ribosome-associated protein
MKKNKQEPIIIITISEEPIELCKVLKLAGLSPSGGQAKSVIAAGLVRVNEKVETRKRKKIVGGDVIDVAGKRMQIEIKH